MWRQFLLTCFAVTFQSESLRMPDDNTVSWGLQSVPLLKRFLGECMGDYDKLMLVADPDFSSVESIKNMLDTVNSVAVLNDLPVAAEYIALLGKFITFFHNEPGIKEVQEQLKEGFEDIRRKLNIIQDSIRGLGKVILDANMFSSYLNDRKKIRALGDKLTTWMTNASDEYSQKDFVKSCDRNDMNEWFSAVKSTMDKRYTDGSDFAAALLGVAQRSRGYYTRLARQIKVDMCEATVLLGACDTVLEASDHAKTKHKENVILVYKIFANGFKAMDEDLVVNARNDVSGATENFIESKMSGSGNKAEQVKLELKQKFYWLDFTVTILEVYSTIIISEWPPIEQKVPCVVSTRDIPALGSRWKAIVKVQDLKPYYVDPEAVFVTVQRVVRKCSQAEQPCNAATFSLVTEEMHGGHAVGAYFATAYRDEGWNRYDGYDAIGPAHPPGQKVEVAIFTWNAQLANRIAQLDFGTRRVTVVAMTLCNPFLYKY